MTTKSEASYARLKCCFSRKREREGERDRERQRYRERERETERDRETERHRERYYNFPHSFVENLLIFFVRGKKKNLIYRCYLKQRLLFLFRSKYTGFDTAHLFERIKQRGHEKD